MPLKVHTCDADSKVATHVAADDHHLYVRFVGGGKTYRYETGDHTDRHFSAISSVKANHQAWLNAHPGEDVPEKNEHGTKPGSEGSYILKHIVGPRKGPKPYEFGGGPISEDEARKVFGE
jgi:hypothetical protein